MRKLVEKNRQLSVDVADFASLEKIKQSEHAEMAVYCLRGLANVLYQAKQKQT